MTAAGGVRRRAAVAALILAGASVAACTGDAATPAVPSAAQHDAAALPTGSQPVDLDPADFTVDITNRWWPMKPGDQWKYEEDDGQGGVQQVEVTVLDRTRKVANGIEARVVHDVVSEDGNLVEDTHDWYAQDADGNVWYLGEQTAEYENGKVASTEGSWEAGVNGAQPGIAIPADPRAGTSYRQEYLKGHAEDDGFILSADEKVQVPAGKFTGALLTRDTTPLEPDLVELKFYAPDVGPVMEVAVSGEAGRQVLLQSTRTD
jgi:hypothetical protein